MLKKFFLVVCGSFVGVWLALTVFTIVAVISSFAIFGSLASMSKSTSAVSISSNSILHLDLSGEIYDRDGMEDVDVIGLLQGEGMPEGMSLNAIVTAIREAEINDNIKGIFIECNGASAGIATRYEIRDALKKFKESGKFIYAYGHEGISQGDYFLASVADSIFLNPEGMVELRGLASATPYFKKLMDKVGVEMQIIRVGTFKSAVEPYMIDSISPANRLQQETYLGNIWASMVDSISASRKISPESINALTDNMISLMPADSLVANKIVDKLIYRADFDNRLRKLTEVDEDKKLNLVSVNDLASVATPERKDGKDEIAVLYAIGEIDGSDDSGIVSDDLCETIYELKNNKDVKGLVLRVNSPGGSAFGSEQIWKALDDFKKEGKTLAVSMGDLAASGGYYISAGAERIFAQPSTLTGSIGIFGMIPCVNELVENKLGVYISVVKTNKNSDMGVITKPLTPFQKESLQNMVNRGYDLFTNRCAQGRHVSQDSIKQIAEGRVWDGMSAKKIGLVDEFGNIDSAVAWVAKKAKLGDDYRVCEYPSETSKWEKMLKKYMSVQTEKRMKDELGFLYDYFKQAQRVLGRRHVLCLMEPVEIE